MDFVAESIKIHGKCSFIFYEQDNFLGNAHILTEGDYPSLNFDVSSARALPPEGTIAIVFFEYNNYRGQMAVFHSSQYNWIFYEHTSSVIVIGGYWTVYERYDYTAFNVHLFDPPNYYPTLSALGIARIRSVRNWCSTCTVL